jgi:hypothetical protein
MISLSDSQIARRHGRRSSLEPEKRGVYLQRIVVTLQVRCGRYTDSDVAAAAQTALPAWCSTPILRPEPK